jgi:hypothetical protein
MCEIEEETVLYAIWSCTAAQDVWSVGPIIFQKRFSWGDNLVKVLTSLQDCCKWEELALRAVIVRRIWLQRNSVVHNGCFTHPNMVYREVFLAQEDFKSCNSKEEQAQDILLVRDIVNVGQSVWHPSPFGVI